MSSSKPLDEWLAKLGYSAEPSTLHRRGEHVPESHPYALELGMLLKPDGAVRAQAVFDVEGVPTVVFVGDGHEPLTTAQLDAVRQRIWNQNLATVVIEIQGETALALPARRLAGAGELLALAHAQSDGPFSAADIVSANLARRAANWFDVKARVDRQLLNNLDAVVRKLARTGFVSEADESVHRRRAELLMGQLLFISYLEHREIVADTYRARREVEPLHALITRGDRAGIRSLIDALRQDFNGDFLGDDRHDPWSALADAGFSLLDQFLRRTDMETGQGDFWNYDFSFIPVELLSGVYESFLSPDQQAKEGAYYTPRHLAMLAVDQAFATVEDPLDQTIFDGACGSGILLTTAYRRLIALSEARLGRRLGFKERGSLLCKRIFGGDINFMACRVTAFSLYLSLLEGLNPADILEAQERESAKLPSLSGINLQHGAKGDFFNANHGFAGRRFTLLISNPPWSEPEGAEVTSADTWVETANVPFVRRQIAGAYALRAQDFVADNGRVCLILPIGQLLGRSSASFVAHLLEIYLPFRLINFGDLQGLLFPTAENTCHVFIAARRPIGASEPIPYDELFDYCVPKADMSLAFGRLTMQSADRHTVQTRAIAQDPQRLVTLMWGDLNDIALWTRLSARGTFADLWRGPREFRRWVNRKGIHLNDKSREAIDAGPLRDLPFVPVPALSAGLPVLQPALLQAWPAEQETVVGLNDDIMAVFEGPRVLFPDGFSRQEHAVRAVYFDGPASFTHSIGVIAGGEADAPLLKFAAVYLRSSLARYFLMMRGWKMLCERNGVHLSDVEAFPFFDPANAPDPESAGAALAEVDRMIEHLRHLPDLAQAQAYDSMREAFDAAVFRYFGVSADEQALVQETVALLMPSIRPRGFKSLDTPAQQKAREEDVIAYASALAESLTDWRERTGGRGWFHVSVVASELGRTAPSGVVRVHYVDDPTAPPKVDTSFDDDVVQMTLAALRKAGLSMIPSGDTLQLVPDTHLWLNGALYIARHLTRRSWTVRQARRDAEFLVREVQGRTKQHAYPEVA